MKLLRDLKVAELRRELEEREADATGNKATLRERLNTLLEEVGEDPEQFMFEEEDDAMKAKLDELAGNVNSQLTNLELKLQGVVQQTEVKLTECLGDMKALEERIAVLEVEAQRPLISPSLRDCVKSPTELFRIELPTFDGKTPWVDYFTLFETAAKAAAWTEDTKAIRLSLLLRGDALAVLQTIPLDNRKDFTALVAELELRFGQKHMTNLFRSELRHRTQKPSETLQAFQTDIRRLVKQAYPSLPHDVFECLAVDKFADGLLEMDTQQAVKLSKSKTLQEALCHALEFESVKRTIRGNARLRETEGSRADGASTVHVDEMVDTILQKLDEKKKQVRCWHCRREGHLRRRCPRLGKISEQSENL